MNRRVGLLVVLVLLVGAAGGPQVTAAQSSTESCTYPATYTDATGAEVTIESPPATVVALGPSAARTMWELDAADQVVGLPINDYTSDLEGAEERVNVFNPDDFTVNLERVVALEPDLVLAPNVIPDETVEQLRAAGLTVYKFPLAGTLGDVERKTVRTGQLTGNCEAATERVAWMNDRLESIQETVADEPRPRVVYPLGGGFVAGDGTFLHELVRAAGGRNIAAEANLTGYASISIEVIVTANPEWVVLNEDTPRTAIQQYAYNHTTAGRQEQFIRVDPNLANQPSPSVVLVVEQIARALHPEAFEAADATATSTSATPTSTTPGPTTTATAGQSGFGVVVGLGAVALTLVLARLWT